MELHRRAQEQTVIIRSMLSQQLSNATTRIIDKEGSLEFCINSGSRAHVSTRVPIEAWAADTDGINVNISLHVVDGKVIELEIYKSDSSEIIRMPPPSEWELFEPG